ncbi:MAG TPA: hypothetical protein VGN01_07655 [Acidobacteriaceae bacterium]|jgi:hypothetical protein
MKLFVYEGSPAEIAEVAQLIGAPTKNPVKTADVPEADEKAAEPSEGLSVEQIKLVFERRALGKPYKIILQHLYKAGENRVKSEDLRKALNYTKPQFRGLLGAFARRLKKTTGIPKGARLFDEVWDEDLRQKTWTLPLNVRTALEDLKII